MPEGAGHVCQRERGKLGPVRRDDSRATRQTARAGNGLRARAVRRANDAPCDVHARA